MFIIIFWLGFDRPSELFFPARFIIIIIIIIIIIKKGRQCKAGRDWYTPYQSEDPSPTISTNTERRESERE